MLEYEPGRYWGKVLSQAMGTTKNGNAQFILHFEVLGKVDPSNPGSDLLPCPRNERRIYMVITEKTGKFVLDGLVQPGFYQQRFAFPDPDREGQHHCHGPKWGVASNGFKPGPPDAKVIKKLDSLFAKELKQASATAPKRNSGPPATEAELAGAKSDDIPF